MLAVKVPLLRLSRVARADYLGRTTPEALATTDSRNVPELVWLMHRAAELNVQASAPRPLLLGRHLLALGCLAGPQLGVQLQQAFEAQLDGAFADEAGALDWARNNLPVTAPAPNAT